MKNQNKKKMLFFQILLFLIPSVLWLVGISLRGKLIFPYCQNLKEVCVKESLFFVDQLSFGMRDSKADSYSFFTQNLSGLWALGVLFFMALWSFVVSQKGFQFVFFSLLDDCMLFFQAIGWNGFFTEISHLISQRARPFVYMDTFYHGKEVSHYTSFYSGHTSFSAVTQTILFLILWKKKVPPFFLLLSACLGEVLVISTAYFRVLAGRHFLTDVLSGAVAGICTAFLIYHLSPYYGLKASFNRAS